MANATAVSVKQDGGQQFRGVWNRVWTVTATLDVDNLADGAGDVDTVAVPGVALGDQVIALSLGVSVAGMIITGYVSAADTVTLQIQNESTGAVNLASAELKLVVGRPAF